MCRSHSVFVETHYSPSWIFIWLDPNAESAKLVILWSSCPPHSGSCQQSFLSQNSSSNVIAYMFSPPFDFCLLSQCPLPVWPDWLDLALTLPPAWARQTARAAAHIPVHRWRAPPAARSLTTRTDRKPWRCSAKAPRTKPPFVLGSSACWTSAPRAAFCPLWGFVSLYLSLFFVLFVLMARKRWSNEGMQCLMSSNPCMLHIGIFFHCMEAH